MSSDNNEIFFNGESGAECEAFIQLVYAQAWREGHTWDGAWIAAFVSMCFRGKALRWYAKLPLETRRDWELVLQGLLERWPSEDDEATPSPAAAAPPITSSSFKYKVGRLKAKFSGSDVARWVSTDTISASLDQWKGGFTTTSDSEKALNVQIIPLADQLWRLKMLNHPSGCHLVAMYGTGSWDNNFGILVGVDIPQGLSLQEHRSTYCGNKGNFEFKTDIWSFNAKGPSLSIHSKAADKPGGAIYLKRSADDIVLDNTPPPKHFPGMELFFEPLDL